MSKKRIDSWIPAAKQALIELEIVRDGHIDKGFLSQITEFGAAVVMGRLRSAVAFYADSGNAEVDREKLVSAMYFCIFGEIKSAEDVLEFVYENESPDLKEKFTDASVALKLAMNFFSFRNGEAQDE